MQKLKVTLLPAPGGVNATGYSAYDQQDFNVEDDFEFDLLDDVLPVAPVRGHRRYVVRDPDGPRRRARTPGGVMADIELAWAAGFFDGEGSFHAHASHKTNPKLAISISQKDREVLDRFHAAVSGIGGVNGPYEYDTRGRTFNYRAYNRDAEAVFELLRPFLGSIKVAQAEAVLGRVYGG